MNNTIQFTQGNATSITLYAEDEFGAPIDITNATFVTQFPGSTSVVEFGTDKHEIVDAAKGQYKLNLLSADTALVEAGQDKDILSTMTQSGNPLTFRGIGLVQVFAPASPTAVAGKTNIFFGAAL